MEYRVAEFQRLFESVHRHKSQGDVLAYNSLRKEMEQDGYKIEQAWGWYLHCPDGTTITLDYWNELP